MPYTLQSAVKTLCILAETKQEFSAPNKTTPRYTVALQANNWQTGLGGGKLCSTEDRLIHIWLRAVSAQCIDKELIPLSCVCKGTSAVPID